MKKIYSLLIGLFLAVVIAMPVSSAAVSTNVPCDGKPVIVCPVCGQSPCICQKPEAPRGPYKRNVIGNVIPTNTEKKGLWNNQEAAGYNEKIVTGSDKY